MKKFFFIISLLSIHFTSQAQNVQDLIDEVSLTELTSGIDTFSGESSTIVNGNTVTIINRVSNNDNNLAADYLVERLQNFNNIAITDNIYSTSGRNIIATQIGNVNPNDIYMICGHYDATANYCADDNASGTVAILEIARILSEQCIDNTIVYAFWDEEELGLIGAANYAAAASARGDNIKAVLNLDMMGFDGDGDNEFDIDVRNIANSIAMKDDLVNVLNTYNSSINLNVNIVDPGTPLSDHKPFWDQNYTAVLLGEAWSKNDQNTAYHTANDRVNLMDMSYFHDMTKLCMAYIATKAGIDSNNTDITLTGNTLQATQLGATYQWIDCNNRGVINGATNQSLLVNTTGDYAVEITINGCTESSECYTVTTLSNSLITQNHFTIYPNPTRDFLNIKRKIADDAMINIYNLKGEKILTSNSQTRETQINLKTLTSGLYFIEVSTIDDKQIEKFIKE